MFAKVFFLLVVLACMTATMAMKVNIFPFHSKNPSKQDEFFHAHFSLSFLSDLLYFIDVITFFLHVTVWLWTGRDCINVFLYFFGGFCRVAIASPRVLQPLRQEGRIGQGKNGNVIVPFLYLLPYYITYHVWSIFLKFLRMKMLSRHLMSFFNFFVSSFQLNYEIETLIERQAHQSQGCGEEGWGQEGRS